MKRSFEQHGSTVTLEAKVWEKTGRPKMVFFSRNGKQEAAWNVTEQKWSPKNDRTNPAFLDRIKNTFGDVMEIAAKNISEAEALWLEFMSW